VRRYGLGDDASDARELNELRGAIVSTADLAHVTASALQQAKVGHGSSLRRQDDLRAAIKAAGGAARVSGLGEHTRARPRNRMTGLGGSGEDFYVGQLQKVQSWADQGYYPTMLEAAVRVARGVYPTDAPEAVLRDPVKLAAVSDVVHAAMTNDGGEPSAQLALISMRASVLGQTDVPVPFDRAEYDAAVQGDLRYIQMHAPHAGFFTRTLSQVGGVVASLDRYVPGWTFLLEAATPVLPFAPALQALLASLPVVGGALSTVQQALPLVGGKGFTGSAPLGFSQASTGLTAQMGAELHTATAAGVSPLTGEQLLADYVPGSLLQAPGLVQASQALVNVSAAASPIKFTLTKSAAQAAQAGDGVLSALERVGTDLLDAYAFGVSLVATFLTAGADLALVAAVQAALAALKVSISLAKTIDAANAMKRAADRAKKAAQASAAKDAADERALEDELARIRARIAGFKPAPGVGVKSAPLSPLARVGLGILAGLVLREVLS